MKQIVQIFRGIMTATSWNLFLVPYSNWDNIYKAYLMLNVHYTYTFSVLDG